MYYTQILVLQVYVFIVVSLFQKYVFILEYNFYLFHYLSIYIFKDKTDYFQFCTD